MTADLFDHEREIQPATLFEQYHLTAARDGDTILLRQIDHSGNEAAIALHVSQLRLLADEFLHDTGSADAAPMPANLDGPDEMATLSVDVEEGGAVLVSQTRIAGMGGTDAFVELHPIQVAWLAAKLSRIAGQSNAGPRRADDK